jgi:hypothetical protein
MIIYRVEARITIFRGRSLPQSVLTICTAMTVIPMPASGEKWLMPRTFEATERYLWGMNTRSLWLVCAFCAVLHASDALAQDADKPPPPASKPAAKDKATDPAKPKAKAKAKEPANPPATTPGNPPATPPSDQPAQPPADANGKSDGASGGKSGAAKRAPEAEVRPCKPLDQLPPEMHKWANLAMSGKFKEFTRLAARRQALYVKSSELRMAMRGTEPTERQFAEVKSVQDEIGKVGDQMDALTAGKGWTQEDYAVMDFIVAQQFELNPIK